MPPKTGKEALLTWCKNNTAGYKDVNIVDFSLSWQDGLFLTDKSTNQSGLAFCALIHRFYPHKIDFNSLNKEEKAKNLKLAFDTAEALGIPSLLDVEDMLIPKPEPLSTITYLSQFYHKFSKMARHSMNVSKNMNLVDFQAWSEDVNKQNENAAKKAEEHKAKNEEIQKENERRMQENQKRLSMWKQQQTQSPTKQKSDNCAKCGEPLEGETVEISSVNKEYHKRCFVCTSCNKKLGSKPLLVEDFPYCEQCGKQAFIKFQLGKRNDTTPTSPNPEIPRNESPKPEPVDKMRSASIPPKPVATTTPATASSPSVPPKQPQTTTATPSVTSNSSSAPPTTHPTTTAPSTQPTPSTPADKAPPVQSPTIAPKTTAPPSSSTSSTSSLVCVQCRNKQPSGKYCSKCGGLLANTDSQPSPTTQTKPRNVTVSSPTSTPKSTTIQQPSNASNNTSTSPAIKTTTEPSKTEAVKTTQEPVKVTPEPQKAEANIPVSSQPVKQTQEAPKTTETKPTATQSTKPVQEAPKPETKGTQDTSKPAASTQPVESKPTTTQPTKQEQPNKTTDSKPQEKDSAASQNSPISPQTSRKDTVTSPQTSRKETVTSPQTTRKDTPIASPQPNRSWQKFGISELATTRQSKTSLHQDDDASKGQTLYGISSLDALQKEDEQDKSGTMYGEQLTRLKSTRGNSQPQTEPPRDSSPPPDKKIPLPPHRVVSLPPQQPNQSLPPKNYHTRTDDEAIQLSGWLLKRDTTGSVRRWRRRWFVVQRDQLLYWKEEPEKFTLGRERPPQGSISLREVVSVEPDLENGRPFAFKIVAHQMTYCFQADDEESEFRWIAGLVQVVCVLQLEEREKDKIAQQQHLVLNVDTTMFTKEGILKVRSGVFNNWKERFVILKGGVLFFQGKKKQTYSGKFALYNAKLEEYEPESQPNCFKITDMGTEKSVIIKASSEEEMHSWLNAIVKQKLIITEIIDCITIE